MEDTTETQEAPVQAPVEGQTQPTQVDPPAQRVLYKTLVDKKFYTKSYDDFKKQFSTTDKTAKLHDLISRKGLYTKDINAFNKQFFPDVKPVESDPEKKSPVDFLHSKEFTPTPQDIQQKKDWDDLEHSFDTLGNGSKPSQDHKDAQVNNVLANNEHQIAQQKEAIKSPVNTMITDYGHQVTTHNINIASLSTNPITDASVHNKITKQQYKDSGGRMIYDPDMDNKINADKNVKQMPASNQGTISKGNLPTFSDHVRNIVIPFDAGVLKGVADLTQTAKELDQTIGKALTAVGLQDAGKTKNIEEQENTLQDEFDKKANLGYNEEYLNSNPITGVAKMIPMLLGGESNGAKIAGFQAWGSASAQVDKMKAAGAKFENGSDLLYKGGSALINYFLMKDVLGTTLLKSAGQETFNGIVGAAAADATKELAEKGADATANDYAAYYSQKAMSLAAKIQTMGISAVKTYAKVGSDFAAANLAQTAVKATVNAMNTVKPLPPVTGDEVVKDVSSPFYNGDTPANGDLKQFVGNMIATPAAAFSALHIATESGMLFNHSPYLNPVIESLQKDHSPDNIQSLKDQLGKYGKDNGWRDDEIRATHGKIDELADIASKVPKDIHPEKFSSAVNFILDRRHLEGVLEATEARKADLDPSLQDKATNFEELLKANIDQANDRLNVLVTDKPFTYFEHQGEYFKVQQDGTPVKITKSRYDLEGINNDRSSIGSESVIMKEGESDKKGNPIPETDEKTKQSKSTAEAVSEKPEPKPTNKEKPANKTDEPSGSYEIGQKLYNEDGDEFLLRSKHGDTFSIQKMSDPEKPLIGATSEDLDKLNLSPNKSIKVDNLEDQKTYELKIEHEQSPAVSDEIDKKADEIPVKEEKQTDKSELKKKLDEIDKQLVMSDNDPKKYIPYSVKKELINERDKLQKQIEYSEKTDNTSDEKTESEEKTESAKEKAQKDFDSEKSKFDDFIKNSRKTANTFANLGEFSVRAAKLMVAYAKLGIHKFADMIARMRKEYGDDFVDKNLDELKSAYGVAKVDPEHSDADKFDTDNTVLLYNSDTANLKTAYNKKKTFDTSVKKSGFNDELLKDFASIDPRYLIPTELNFYNSITKDKSLSELNRNDVAQFIDDLHNRQDEEAEEREKQWYKQLKDDPDFEDTDIKKVIKDVSGISGTETDLDNTKENNTAKDALKKLLSFGRKELKNTEDITGFEAAKKALLDLDESKLSSRNLRDLNRAIEGVITDGNYAGTGKWVALNDSVKKASEILAAQKKTGYKTGETSKIPGELRSLPQNIEIMVKDSKVASVIQDKSGIFDISSGNAKVNTTMNKVTKDFTKLTDGMPKDIQSVENRYKRGVLAAFTQQSETDSPQAHFDRYKDYVETTARRLLRSTNSAEKAEGKLVQDIYDDHIKNAKSSDDVVKSLTNDNPNNAKIVKFFIDKHQEIYSQLRHNTLLYSGKELPLIQNYTSTQMKMLRSADDQPVEASAIIDPVSMDKEDLSTDTGQSRTTISRKKSIGPKRVMNLNFDPLQLNRLRESHYDVQTLASRYLFDAIRTQPDFKEALGNSQKNVNVLSNGVATMVRAQRGFSRIDPVAKMVLDLTNMLGTAGTRIALKGVDMFVKHYPARAINTISNLGTDMDLFFKSVVKVGAGHQKIFGETPVALRGLQKGGTDIEGSLRQLQKYDFSTAGEWLNAIHKVFNKTDKLWSAPLTVADELVAKQSWAAYYMKDLRKRGIDIDNIDFSTEHDKMDKEAAAYAEQMVSRNEIPNDPTQRAGVDQRGNIESWEQIMYDVFKKLALPFTSYSRNIQVRLENDIRKFYGGNRKEAAKSIASTIAETSAFQALKLLLKMGTSVAAGYILTQFDFDEPKHDFKKDVKQLPAQTFDDMFLAGTGSMADNVIKNGVNSAYQMATGNENNYIFKNYDPASFGETDFGLAGMYGILPNTIHNAWQDAHYATGNVDAFADGFSKNEGPFKQKYESQLTDKQKELAQMVFALDIASIGGLSGATTQRLNSAIFNEIKKQKSPVRFHSGFEHNKKSNSIKVGPKILGE